MEIKHSDNGSKGSFRAFENGTEAGIISYTWHDENTFIIEHTIGKPEFKGVGTILLNATVDFARQKGVKIIPVCSFAKKMFERRPEINDVLATS